MRRRREHHSRRQYTPRCDTCGNPAVSGYHLCQYHKDVEDKRKPACWWCDGTGEPDAERIDGTWTCSVKCTEARGWADRLRLVLWKGPRADYDWRWELQGACLKCGDHFALASDSREALFQAMRTPQDLYPLANECGRCEAKRERDEKARREEKAARAR